MKEAPKVKEAVKQGYASIDEVIKLSSRKLEPEEVEGKIMEEEPIISEIDTSSVIICPICNKKLRHITGKEVSEEEMRRMSAFRDFIDTLDMDDFDKRKS